MKELLREKKEEEEIHKAVGSGEAAKLPNLKSRGQMLQASQSPESGLLLRQ